MIDKDISDLLKAAAVNWVNDYAQSMGAALAFYTMFSIAPLLLIVISVAGLVSAKRPPAARSSPRFEGMLGSQGRWRCRACSKPPRRPAEARSRRIFGLVVLFIGATSVFAELQDALDRIWRAPAGPEPGPVGSLRARLLSFGMILGIGFLLMVSLAFSAGLAALNRWWHPLFESVDRLASAMDLAISVVLSTLVFAMIYKAMPRVRIDWKDVWIGAAFTSVLFVAGKYLIGVYIGRTGISSAFGAAASLVVVLLWVYYSAQIFLFGAEFTWVYSHRFGSRKGVPRPGAPAEPAAAA